MQSRSWRDSDNVVDAFAEYLRGVRGQTVGTHKNNVRCVRDFLDMRYGYGAVDLKRLVPKDADRFILKQAKRYKPKTINTFGSALRNFFRFLQMKGVCNGQLFNAVPKIPQWRLSSLPPSLTREEIQKFLDSFDRSTPMGKRDYAIALCLVFLGLRAGEVANLTLEDLDWRSGTLRVPLHKTRRRDLLPLPTVVGRAIVRYLRDGRPESNQRHVFIGHLNRHRGWSLDAPGIRRIVRDAFDRAGLKPPSRGTHILRHTAATQMLRKGASIKDIADVLRHRSLDTTVIYTKVDLPALKGVALPWPEVRP